MMPVAFQPGAQTQSLAEACPTPRVVRPMPQEVQGLLPARAEKVPTGHGVHPCASPSSTSVRVNPGEHRQSRIERASTIDVVMGGHAAQPPPGSAYCVRVHPLHTRVRGSRVVPSGQVQLVSEDAPMASVVRPGPHGVHASMASTRPE